ncbi:aldehyde dehydrogenase family protein [Niabella beijingensis]|uniref:aldehyde dehydrogenase family protein n=1 Tax=Niabella beijingensis TaxID=2872700 RepID=UPI001CBBF8FC|nr:aldehyde dehydrogenase family protein [Niabella beijingensis]MBZ4188511.1 aldehyde dehydrogenase family protein [Niabella beijingensis]
MTGLTPYLNAMRSFFNTGATRPPEFRKKQLQLLKEQLLKYEEALNQALFEDLHKSREEVWITETGMVLSEINTAIKGIDEWTAPQPVPTNFVNLPGKSSILYEPLGVVLIIAPWNYPFQLLFMPLIGAIAAGNCVVLKPSELATSTEKVMGQLINEAFAPEYIRYVPGDGASVIPALMDNFRFDHVFYTGSTAVGKIIYQKAAAQLSPVTLELGGKSPCIITRSAPLKVAARRIINVKFSNAGQMCITPDYLLVHNEVKAAFIQLLKTTLLKFYGENPITSYDYGRIINPKHFHRLKGLMEGQQLLHGGEHNEDQLFIAPTLIDNPSLESPVMKEEIFGPLLPVIGYETEEAAMAVIRQNPDPLAFYVFTNDKKEADRWLQQVPFGGGCVNTAALHYLNKHLPFGGRGNSGIGRYHGRFSFETFSHAKGILKAHTWPDIPLAYPSLKGKLNTLKRVIK